MSLPEDWPMAVMSTWAALERTATWRKRAPGAVEDRGRCRMDLNGAFGAFLLCFLGHNSHNTVQFLSGF